MSKEIQSEKDYLDKIIEEVRLAYTARTPLIFFDTYERELVLRTLWQGQDRLVNFVKLPRAAALREKLYYEFVGGEPNGLEHYVNLFVGDKNLKNLENLKNVSGQLDERTPGAAFIAALVSNDREEYEKLSILREHVKRYVQCRDMNCPLKLSLVALYGDSSLLPTDLKQYTRIVSIEYPSSIVVLDQILRLAEESGNSFENSEDAHKLADALMGFSYMDVERTVNKLLRADQTSADKNMIFDDEGRQKIIRKEKQQNLLRNGEILKLYKKDEPEKRGKPEDLGGMENYKSWVTEYRDRMRESSIYACEWGVDAPKGVLLCGVPGCGKSNAAKILCAFWGLDMVILNIDELMAGIVGQSEERMRGALKQSEAMAPCILWIDELEKGFSDAKNQGGESSSGTFKRMFGRLLTWMQENKRPVFIFATANDISQLPQEFFRSGRFDALFSVFMPTGKECQEIFKNKMEDAEELHRAEAKRQGREVSRLFQNACTGEANLERIMQLFTQNAVNGRVKFVSGADIKKITEMALSRLSREKKPRPISPSDWLQAVKDTILDSRLSTYGGTSGGLDSIAICYYRLLRGNFTPASASDQVLFQSEDFQLTWDEYRHAQVRYLGEVKSQDPYDVALFNALKGRIERYGAFIEEKELERAL